MQGTHRNRRLPRPTPPSGPGATGRGRGRPGIGPTLAAAVLLGVLVGCRGDGPTEPDGEEEFGPREWIYFAAEGLHRIRPDGRREDALLAGLGVDSVLDFAFSPDRTEIAVVVERESEGRTGFDLLIVDPDGDGPVWLTRQLDDPDTEPGVLEVRWAPDAERLAVTVADPASPGPYLGIIPREGGTVVPLTSPGGPPARHPRWSPDGRAIAYLSSSVEGLGPQIHLVGPDGSGDFRLTDGPAAEVPVWSPDGGLLAFATWRDAAAQTDANAYTAVSDGSGTTLLLATSFERANPVPNAWSPGGRWIAFTAESPETHGDVFVMTAQGGNVRPLVTEPFTQRDPTFSPDGSHLVAIDPPWTFWVVGIDGPGTHRFDRRRKLFLPVRRVVWVDLPPG